jgi:hypothetical protein
VSDGAAPARQPITQEDLRRWIRITGRLTVLGLVASIFLIGFNAYKAAELDKQIAQKQAKLKELETAYSTALKLANAPVKEIPIFDQIQPKAKAVTVGAQKDSTGNQQYDFTVWLDAPDTIRSQIEKVTYYFDHPSFIDKTKWSTDPSNGFAVSYRGWGALRLVTITVQLKDGTSHSYYFDMVKALSWGT